jgi:cobyric acid synthase
LKHRVGLVYVQGALPCFETFGNLPTDLVREDGLVAGCAASDVLDMIIIPGGSIVESQSVGKPLETEILKMADRGKLVLGVCSGFQILSKGTDIGRLSPTPIRKPGLGLLDVEFKPLICTDQVKATIISTNRLTDALGAEVSGFHCHTYGEITVQKNAKTFLISHVKRLNYGRQQQDIVSGASNCGGNVVGVLPHALLDKNPVLIEGIIKSLGIDATELQNIRLANVKLQASMKAEVGISTQIYHKSKVDSNLRKKPRFLLITALESGGGKTFVATGLAAALKVKGWRVGVIKVGGDVRDIVPALYLIKEPMQDYSSIMVAETGWKDAAESVKAAERDYDFIVIEGAMNAFTGLLFDQLERPSSTAEVAAALGVPTVIVSGCDKEGIEGGIVNAINYVHFFKKLGIKTVGVILNKVYLDYMDTETRLIVKEAFARAGAELLGIVPIADAEGRGAIPEIEVRYEKFGAKALETAENSLNLERIVEVAEPLSMVEFDYGAFVERFKKALIASIGFE